MRDRSPSGQRAVTEPRLMKEAAGTAGGYERVVCGAWAGERDDGGCGDDQQNQQQRDLTMSRDAGKRRRHVDLLGLGHTSFPARRNGEKHPRARPTYPYEMSGSQEVMPGTLATPRHSPHCRFARRAATSVCERRRPAESSNAASGSLGGPTPNASLCLPVVETGSPRHPRASKNVKRTLEVVLTIVWLGGMTFLLEVLHTGLLGPIVLLVVVVVVETAFTVWNDGHLPGASAAAE